MSRIMIASLLGVALLLGAQPTQAQHGPAASVVVFVDGAAISESLRGKLARQFGQRIQTLGELAQQGERPSAVLGVEYRSRRDVRIVYLDTMGRSEVLDVPMPPGVRVQDVVLGLASAVLSRNLPALEEALRARAASIWMDPEWDRIAALALSGRHATPTMYSRHRTVMLSLEDF